MNEADCKALTSKIFLLRDFISYKSYSKNLLLIHVHHSPLDPRFLVSYFKFSVRSVSVITLFSKMILLKLYNLYIYIYYYYISAKCLCYNFYKIVHVHMQNEHSNTFFVVTLLNAVLADSS